MREREFDYDNGYSEDTQDTDLRAEALERNPTELLREMRRVVAEARLRVEVIGIEKHALRKELERALASANQCAADVDTLERTEAQVRYELTLAEEALAALRAGDPEQAVELISNERAWLAAAENTEEDKDIPEEVWDAINGEDEDAE